MPANKPPMIVLAAQSAGLRLPVPSGGRRHAGLQTPMTTSAAQSAGLCMPDPTAARDMSAHTPSSRTTSAAQSAGLRLPMPSGGRGHSSLQTPMTTSAAQSAGFCMPDQMAARDESAGPHLSQLRPLLAAGPGPAAERTPPGSRGSAAGEVAGPSECCPAGWRCGSRGPGQRRPLTHAPAKQHGLAVSAGQTLQRPGAVSRRLQRRLQQSTQRLNQQSSSLP